VHDQKLHQAETKNKHLENGLSHLLVRLQRINLETQKLPTLLAFKHKIKTFLCSQKF